MSQSDDHNDDEPTAVREPSAKDLVGHKKKRGRKTVEAHAAPATDEPAVEEAAAAALAVDEAEAAAEAAAAEAAAAEAAAEPGDHEATNPLAEAAPPALPPEPGAEGAEAAAADEAPPVGDGREAPERLKSIVESLIFASDKPLSIRKLQELTGERDAERIQGCIEFLRADYGDRGVVLHEVAGGWQFRTHPLNAHWVQQLIAGRPVKLSRAQLETMAIVAYRQPITRPEVDEIRGVDSGGTLKVLLDRGLVRILGKKEEPGRPMLYGTSKDFLEFFNLKDLKELPTLREFYELSEDSMAKIRELDDKRAEEGLPAVGAAAGEDAPTTPIEVPATPADVPAAEVSAAPPPDAPDAPADERTP